MNLDYQQEMVGTTQVPDQDRLDETRLTEWMTIHVEGFTGPIAMSKFKGGQSNPTYRLDTLGKSYVLRRQPFGKLLPSAHAVDREYAVMSALNPAGFPVPRVYALCEDPEVIGSMFFVMDMIEGRSLWNGALPDAPPEQRSRIYGAMIDTIADLHRHEPRAIGLADFGKPTDYCARQIARWSRQYELSQSDHIPEMAQLIEWLPATIPPQHASRIVHGDFRLDNLLFDRTEDRVMAVLDWELSTLGDPIADFAYLMLNWVSEPDGRAAIGGLNHAALGIPTLQDAVARYVERTGFPVPPMDWYFAYNLFRVTGIMQGIRKRVIDGTASSAHAKELSASVPSLAQRAHFFAKKAGMN